MRVGRAVAEEVGLVCRHRHEPERRRLLLGGAAPRRFELDDGAAHAAEPAPRLAPDERVQLEPEAFRLRGPMPGSASTRPS